MGEIKKIPVTEQNLWFLQRQIGIFDIRDFFPKESFGAAKEEDNPTLDYEVKYLTIRTDAGFSFKTDIAKDKMILRKRSKATNGTGKWMVERQVKAGDTIYLERLGEYEYYLYKESGSPQEKGSS